MLSGFQALIRLVGDADETALDGSGRGFGAVSRVQVSQATGYVVYRGGLSRRITE
jgi:hypothetical protein